MTDPTRRPNPSAGKTPAPRPAAQPQAAARPAAAQQQRRPAPAPAPAPARRPIRRDGPQEEALDATTKKGLIAAGVLVIIGAAVWIVIGNKKSEEARIQREFEEKVNTFADMVMKVVKDDQATAQTIQETITRIDNEQDKWKGLFRESDVSNGKSRLVGKLDSIKRREVFLAQFAQAEEIVKNAAAKSSDDLRKARQLLTDMEQTGDPAQYGPQYPDQIKSMKEKIDNMLVGKLRDEAKAFASASGTSPRQGLAKYAEAEDYIRKAVQDAKKTPNEGPYTEIYKGLLAESDEYAKRVITQEFMDSIPWKDLLNGEMASKWSKVTTIPGFACRIENGTLTVSPPEPGSKQQGVCGILDQKGDNLRNFVLDMEFAVDGVATMFFHVSPPPANPDNRQSATFDLNSKEGGLKANERYDMVVKYVGSDLAIWFPKNEEIQRFENNPRWVDLRRGGIAFLIPEGTRLRITRMRIRELR